MINGGGIPQKNEVLNQVYANVLGRPVLVPSKSVVSLGSAIFAFLAAGTFKTIEEAQDKICPPHKTYLPDTQEQKTYEGLYAAYRKLYFAFGDPSQPMGDVLPTLIGQLNRCVAKRPHLRSSVKLSHRPRGTRSTVHGRCSTEVRMPPFDFVNRVRKVSFPPGGSSQLAGSSICP